MASLSRTTTDHGEIRRWAEERGGRPAMVKGTGQGDQTGIIRIDFPGFSGEGSLEPISWEEFFEKFDASELAFVYQEQTAGGQRSNFNKLVGRETATARASGERGASRRQAGTAGKRRGRAQRKPATSRQAGVAPQHAIELLTSQHRDLEPLLLELEEAGGEPREGLVDEICELLVVHTRIEERFFYPAIRKQGLAEQVDQAVEEHLAAKRALIELVEGQEDEAEQVAALATALVQAVQAHVREEEDEVFPRVQEAIDPDRLLELGEEMEAAAGAMLAGEEPLEPSLETERPVEPPG